MSETRTSDWRPALIFGLARLVLLAFPLHDFLVALGIPNLNGYGGVDYRLYMDATTRWLHGGPYFNAYQLVGAYPISAGDILYPPVALLLFVPFTFLPAVLWWLLPAAAMVWCLASLGPRPVVWPVLALCLTWPPTLVKVVTGNPVIWAVAAMSMSVLYAWPSVFVLIKPSLFPFALFGGWKRSWWVGLAVFLAISLPFGLLWIDWVRSILNSEGGRIAYSILEAPMLAVPIVAWLGRTRPSPFERAQQRPHRFGLE